MQAKRLFIFMLLACAPVLADEQADMDLLEFLGSDAIEVNGEWIDPLELDIDDSAKLAQTDAE